MVPPLCPEEDTVIRRFFYLYADKAVVLSATGLVGAGLTLAGLR